MKRAPNVKDAGGGNHKVLVCPLEIDAKSLNEAGSFSGYGSIFGNVDLGGDVVERGAFKEIVKTRDGAVRILNQHRMSDPVGKAHVEQDDKGLKLNGQLILDMASARNVYAGMKAGILDGLSIGFDIMPGGAEITNSGTRILKALKLWEVSVVTFGMNPLALIDSVKSNNIKTIREFEEFLRDAGFPKAFAARLASKGWQAASEDRGDPDTEKQAEVVKAVSSLSDVFKSFKFPSIK